MTELLEVTQDQKELLRAVNYANDQHTGQYRKGSDLPYIVHPMAVLKQVREWGVTDIHTLKAAVAHDILEERPNITPESLAKVIGKKAAAIVEELTFIPDPQSTVAISKQKERYLETFLTKSVHALIIKVSDRCCNSLDFFHSGDSKYAPKYWKKGAAIMDALKSREEEIERVFGVEVLANVKFARDSVHRRLVF